MQNEGLSSAECDMFRHKTKKINLLNRLNRIFLWYSSFSAQKMSRYSCPRARINISKNEREKNVSRLNDFQYLCLQWDSIFLSAMVQAEILPLLINNADLMAELSHVKKTTASTKNWTKKTWT